MRQKPSAGADGRARYRLDLASEKKITVALDASMVAQALERALNAFLLRCAIEKTQAAAGLDEASAERTAYDELAAMRRERRGAA
jgi:hypothetical protein